MAGKYNITEVISQTVDKYTAMVEYNGKKAQLTEIDFDTLDRTLQELDPEEDVELIEETQAAIDDPALYVDSQLQQIADADEERTAMEITPVSEILVEDGQVVFSEDESVKE